MVSHIIFNIDEEASTIFVMKVFASQVTEVWRHFAEKELIGQWWAPKPWKCETQKWDFEEGGGWLYAMVSPENEKHFAGAKFSEIRFHRSISWTDFFADENGTQNHDLPSTGWLIGFTGDKTGTKLTVNLHFKNSEEMKILLEMGFEEGFKMCLNQLEEILQK